MPKNCYSHLSLSLASYVGSDIQKISKYFQLDPTGSHNLSLQMGLAREPQNTRGFPEEVDVFLKDGEYPMYVVIHEDFCRSGCPRYIIFTFVFVYNLKTERPLTDSPESFKLAMFIMLEGCFDGNCAVPTWHFLT